MEELQRIAFEIIASVGEAKTLYTEAVKLAKEGNITEARETIGRGNKVFAKAHEHHFSCIQREAEGEELPFSILFLHAEDQLLSTEIMRDMAVQLSDVYEELNRLKEE